MNSGSSTLKLRVVDGTGTVVGRADLDAVDRLGPGQLADALEGLGPVDATGHRVVHGGERYTAPTLIDAAVRARLDELTDLAPLHQPRTLAALDAVAEQAPELPAVACFDTAFHATMPQAATTYAVPAGWREGHGVRRYGFHGLSHAHAARRAVEMLRGTGDTPDPGDRDDPQGSRPAGEALAGTGDAADAGDRGGPRRIVVCHLGAGASLTAVHGGRSIDTTMGFTPLEGLVMATRSGNVDPGAVLWLITRRGFAADEVSDALEHRSGVLGLAGTADMERVVAGAQRGEPAPRLAFDVYVHRLRAGIGAMAATLGGLDALVFTGGVGENSPPVRAAAADGLGFLGVAVDPDANAAPALDADVSAPGAHVRTLVVAAREELEIARGVREVLGDR
ncbi:MAG: acetate/propionate family kinase [Acidimicrobiia bacterium]